MKRVRLRGVFFSSNQRSVFHRILLVVCLLTALLWGNGTAQAAREPNGLEELFWEVINYFRESPLVVTEALGIDIEPWQKVYLQHSLPPLAWSQTAHDVLCEHIEDMLRIGYYSVESPDGISMGDRLSLRGYSPLYLDTTLGLFTLRTVLSESTVMAIFLKNMIEEEIRSIGQEPLKLLNEDFRDIGVCIQPGQLDNIVKYPVNGYVCGLLFATNLQDDKPRILGRVYRDQNENGRWDFGEGLHDVTIWFKEFEGRWQETPVVSNEGIYSFAGEPGGVYRIEVWQAGRLLFRGENYVLGDHNVRLNLVVSNL